MDIQLLRLANVTYSVHSGTLSWFNVFGLCSPSLFLFFITLSHPHYKRPLRGAKGERKKESRGLEQGKWIEGGYCGKRDYCPALSCLNPTILLSFNTFQWRPPTSQSSSAHTICSQTPSSDSVKSVIQPRSSGWGGWVLGGVTSGGVGSFGGTSGRFLTPASSILHGSAQGPHNPLCWDWWPAVVRKNQHAAQTSIHGHYCSEADLWRHSWMYPKQCSCLSSELFSSFTM